jgi:hypothetical protein
VTDFHDWPAQLPPDGFVERTLARLDGDSREVRRHRARSWRRPAAWLLLAACVGGASAWAATYGDGAGSLGEASEALQPIDAPSFDARLGAPRVLEPGAVHNPGQRPAPVRVRATPPAPVAEVVPEPLPEPRIPRCFCSDGAQICSCQP